MAGQTAGTGDQASIGAPRPQGMSDEQWARVQERRRLEQGQTRVVVNPNQNQGTNAIHESMNQAQQQQMVQQDRNQYSSNCCWDGFFSILLLILLLSYSDEMKLLNETFPKIHFWLWFNFGLYCVDTLFNYVAKRSLTVYNKKKFNNFFLMLFLVYLAWGIYGMTLVYQK